jgi:hypothetical protein
VRRKSIIQIQKKDKETDENLFVLPLHDDAFTNSGFK